MSTGWLPVKSETVYRVLKSFSRRLGGLVSSIWPLSTTAASPRLERIFWSTWPTVSPDARTVTGSRSVTSSCCMASGSKVIGTELSPASKLTASASGTSRSWISGIVSASRASTSTFTGGGRWPGRFGLGPTGFSAGCCGPGPGPSGPGCGGRTSGPCATAVAPRPPLIVASCSSTIGSTSLEMKRTEPSAIPASMPSG